MAHPLYHSTTSARTFGGEPGDYLPLHSSMDQSKGPPASPPLRVVVRNAGGIFAAGRVPGVTCTRASDGRELLVRPVLEQHVVEDLGEIPTWGGRWPRCQPRSSTGSDTSAQA